MTFNTRFFHCESFVQSSGDRVRKEYSVTFADNGCKHLYVKREIDIQPEIRSYLGDTLIGNVLAKAALGDTSGLRQVGTESYIDARTFQNMTYAQMHDVAKNADKLFNVLPDEITSKYDSAEDFVASCNGATLGRLIKDYAEKLASSSESEVSVNG